MAKDGLKKSVKWGAIGGGLVAGISLGFGLINGLASVGDIGWLLLGVLLVGTTFFMPVFVISLVFYWIKGEI